jgi:predicted Zn-dependent peptidase
MYEDDPYWQAHFGMLGGLYGSHPVRYGIAGSSEDISAVGVDTLNLLYDSFYTADNAILVLAGDIDESIFELCEDKFNLKPTARVKRLFPKDTGISSAAVRKRLPIATPIFCIGFKENDFSASPIMRMLTSRVLLDILAGAGSVLYEGLYTSGLCTCPLSLDYICSEDCGVSILSGVSQSPEKLLARLCCEIENFLAYGIADKYVKRIVEANKGRLAQNTDRLDFCCNLAADSFAKSIKTLDIYDKYDTINSDELTKRLETHFRADNLCLSEVLPI